MVLQNIHRARTRTFEITSADPFMDLVIWGHEATCQIDAKWNEAQCFHVSQPGNANRIKLDDTDKGKKNMGLLRVAALVVSGISPLPVCLHRCMCLSFLLRLSLWFAVFAFIRPCPSVLLFVLRCLCPYSSLSVCVFICPCLSMSMSFHPCLELSINILLSLFSSFLFKFYSTDARWSRGKEIRFQDREDSFKVGPPVFLPRVKVSRHGWCQKRGSRCQKTKTVCPLLEQTWIYDV